MKQIIKYFLNKGATVCFMLFPFFSALADSDTVNQDVKPVSVTSVLQIFFWLAIVVLIIVLLKWMLKKISGVNTNLIGNIKVISGVHVGQREKIALVQVGDKQILVGITPTNISKLHVMEENIEVVDSINTLSNGSFAEKLRHALIKEKNIK